MNEIKKTSEEVSGEKAFNLCMELINKIATIRKESVEIIPILEEINSTDAYKQYMGDESSTWSSFLGLPEVLLTRSNVRSWLQIKRNLSDVFGIPLEKLHAVKLSKLYLIALYAKNKEEAEDLIAKALTLAPSEWKNVEHEFRGKPVSDDGHSHEFKKYKQCIKCGEKKTDEV